MSEFKDIWDLLRAAGEPGAVLECRQSQIWVPSVLQEIVSTLNAKNYRIRPKTKKQKLYICVETASYAQSHCVSRAYYTNPAPEGAPGHVQLVEIEIDIPA